MTFDLENILTNLIKKRNIVLGVLAGILVLSFGIGYMYQQKLDKQKEASVLFDDAWQKIYAVLSDLQSQPNGMYSSGNPNIPQVIQLYSEAINDVDILINDFGNTTAGARAALLVKVVIPLTNLNVLLNDQTLITMFSEESYLSKIKKNHPQFWGALIAVVEGIEAEQKFDFATAITFYEEALKLDRKKYLRDYILISLARNYEVLEDKGKALEYYEKLTNEFPNSVWLSFAMGKIYILSQNSENVLENLSIQKTE